ncbi:hypothetical protein BZK37_18055 [Enterococcus casseliflavus]|nr:hypothetical protein BZK37_18055 [Enterococcus casseliflavus]
MIILIHEGGERKMNQRLGMVLFLLGMSMQFLPVLFQLGIGGGLSACLFFAWDEYLYRQSKKEWGTKYDPTV